MSGMKNSVKIFYDTLDFIIGCMRALKTNADCRIKWLKDLYLHQFYENRRYQGPTPVESILAFGGRQFNFQCLESQFTCSISSLGSISFMNTETDASNISSSIKKPSLMMKNMPANRRAVKSELISKVILNFKKNLCKIKGYFYDYVFLN